MKAFGSQILAEFIHCQRPILNHKEELEELLSAGIQKYGLELKSLTAYQFEPVGVTAIAIIGESHVAIHTYPEAQHLSLDIFTCSPGSTGPAQLMHYLKEQLSPEIVRHKLINRGNRIEVAQQDYITDFTKSAFDIRYNIQREIVRQRTAYQKMEIIDNYNFGRMLFLDNELQIAEEDCDLYHGALLDPVKAAALKPERVAILGGGDGGILRAVLALDVREAFLVDIDEEVIQAAQKHLKVICGEAFSDPRAQIRIQEAKSFMAQEQGFDLIVYDLTMSPEVVAQDEDESYYPELFERIHRSLNPGGMLTMQVSSRFDSQSLERARDVLQPHFQTVEFEQVFIPSFCEAWIFASARKANASGQV